LTPWAFYPGICSKYQLETVVPRLGRPEEAAGQYITVLGVFGRWVRLDDIDVEAVSESGVLAGNLLEIDGSTQAASILLCVSEN
jgi:hypothetical protein